METLNLYIAIALGLILRLAVPILLTVLVALYLRRLDQRWKAKAEELDAPLEKPECWTVKQCTPEMRAACQGFACPGPCWQAFRLPTGYLREQCLECKVFRRAYVPLLAHK